MNRFFRRTYGVVLSVIIAIAVGCSGSDPIAPSASSPSHSTSRSQSPNRAIISVGQVMISADRTSVEMIPARTADLHLNVVKLLEGKACDDCLKLGDFFITSNDRLIIELTLTHPYHGMLKFSGFDVRAIVITPCDYNFPVAGHAISWDGDHMRLLNPDGYTNAFNPTEFPADSDVVPALKYIPGSFATGGDLTATLNPYIAFKRDAERRNFAPGQTETNKFVLQLVPGELEFGYIVDACWAPVDGDIGSIDDFPPEANCLEAYQMYTRQGAGLTDEAGSYAPVQVELWDHQGIDSVSTVILEAPDLFLSLIHI